MPLRWVFFVGVDSRMADIYYRDRNKGKVDKEGKKIKPNWQYRFEGASIGGVRQEIQRGGFKTKKEAVDAATIAYDEYVNSGRRIAASDQSYSDCLDEWMMQYVSVECNDTTYGNYEKKIRLHIKPALGAYKLSAITSDSIQRFINDMFKRKYSRNTLSVILGIISSSLKYAKRLKYVRYNEAIDVNVPSARVCKNLRSKTRDAIPFDVLAKIYERFPEGHSCHIPIILGERSGVRIGEAFAFLWDTDVDFEHSTITVNKQVQWYSEKQAWRFVPPKYDSHRSIYLDSMTMDLLKRERRKQVQSRLAYGQFFKKLYCDVDGYINSDGRGSEIFPVTIRIDGTYIQPRVMQHCSRVIHTDLEFPAFDFHSLRHTHATRLAECGVNPKEIQRRLGHKTLEITERQYTHHTEVMEMESRKVLTTLYK